MNKQLIIKISVTLILLIVVTLMGISCLQSNAKEPDLSQYVIDGDLVFLNTTKDVKYVGSKNCEKCHKEIYDAYMQSPTGRSLTVMDSTNVIEEFPQKNTIYDSKRNFYYEMIEKDGKYFQREYRLDAEGNLLYERLQEAEYVVGSGSNMRYYAYDENGIFYQLPLTWYVHKNRFDFSPGYGEFFNARFSRYMGPMCASCHNGHMEELETTNTRYKKPLPIGIGCEACHGPSELHSKQCEGEEVYLPTENSLTIVNSAKLSPQRRNDVCLQCHFEGIAWALRGDNSWMDFRPGMLLEEHRSVYTKDEEEREIFLVANSGLRIYKSRCFNGSHGNLTCDFCHDSHGMLTMDKKMFNRQNCLRCHPMEGLPKRASRFDESREDCKRCHLNPTGTDNTAHGVVNHDHWIRIDADKDDIDWTTERVEANDIPLFKLVPVIDAKDNASEIRLGIAYADMSWGEINCRREYLDSARIHLKNGLLKNTTHARGHYYYGRVLKELRQTKKALWHLNKAIELKPDFADAYFRRGNIYLKQNNNETAISNFKAAVNYKSEEPLYLEALGSALYDANKPLESLEILEKALTIDKQNPAVYHRLGLIHFFKYNDAYKALTNFKEVVALDPDYPNGYINVGNVYSSLGQNENAIEYYTREIKTRPNSENAYYNLGRVYHLQGNILEAKKAYKKAFSLNPKLRVPEGININ